MTDTVRSLADSYVTRLADLDTRIATTLGNRPGDDRVPDLSPDGQRARDDLDRSVLAALPGAEVRNDDDRRCARLLRERLEAQLAVSDAGEHLREVRNIFGPHQEVRELFELMPADTPDDWAAVARRMAHVPQAFDGYRASLREGAHRGLHAAPRQLETVAGQLDAWLAGRWFHTFVAAGPETRFPRWGLVSTWFHEGVPGHHLQLAEWTRLADRLSVYQTTIGPTSGNVEGWALYAERLMDELGFLTEPGARLGYLDAQQMRAIRVVVDIGMHLRLSVPTDSPLHAGAVWTLEVAREFFSAHSGRPAAFLDSEIVRYLGCPGQAISYKIGERAWLAGREAARAARGAAFDLKSWHAAALAQGSLGLDDLTAELARL